jgi:hypothetical protein
MEPTDTEGIDGQRCFLDTPPLIESKRLAAIYGCDIAIPNDAGIGNILMYTRVVDDLARSLGRPLAVLTARLSPPSGPVDGYPFPLFQNNPFVERIVDADAIDPGIMVAVNKERDNLCQFSHMIENISYHYGLRPRFLRPSIYLDQTEQAWAIEKLRGLLRPVICLHPHGTSSPLPGHPWHEDNWSTLIGRLKNRATLLEIYKPEVESKNLQTLKISSSLRQMMALIWASDLFIGFDSSMAHIATAFQIPALVMWEPQRKVAIEEKWQAGFAPAVLSRWSYPQNRNIMLLGDRDDAIIGLIVDWAETIIVSLRT